MDVGLLGGDGRLGDLAGCKASLQQGHLRKKPGEGGRECINMLLVPSRPGLLVQAPSSFDGCLGPLARIVWTHQPGFLRLCSMYFKRQKRAGLRTTAAQDKRRRRDLSLSWFPADVINCESAVVYNLLSDDADQFMGKYARVFFPPTLMRFLEMMTCQHFHSSSPGDLT